MFTQKKKAYYSKILGFKTVEDFEDFSKRYLKYLENQTLTKNRIMSGFFILVEIQKEANKNKSLINFDNVIRKAKLREFYLFFLIASLVLGYLLGSFILEFTSIHF